MNIIVGKEYLRYLGTSMERARFDTIEEALQYIEAAKPQGLLYVQSVKREETKDV